MALLSGLGFLAWFLVAAPGSQWLGATLVRGPQNPPQVALTFDDGPGEDTPRILDILKESQVRATFFLCGSNAERFPELARRIAKEGHEIGNHTYSHPRLLGKSPGKIAWEIDRAQKVIAHHTGREPRLFRPPYGLRWFGLATILRQKRLRAVMWSVNALDWRLASERITERVLQHVHPGAIILLHDGLPPQQRGDRKGTVESLPAILRLLGNRYHFVTISEMEYQSRPSTGSGP